VSFPAITGTVATVLRNHQPRPISCLSDVHDADRQARQAAVQTIAG
jgi:1-deoxy-D-xylulose 5-phosphate reductoisomerase